VLLVSIKVGVRVRVTDARTKRLCLCTKSLVYKMSGSPRDVYLFITNGSTI